MVTARDGSDDIVEALDAGANDYITKPVDFAVAQARIRTQLTARRADPLTGLPNRLLFMERVHEQIARSTAAGDVRVRGVLPRRRSLQGRSTTVSAMPPATSS